MESNRNWPLPTKSLIDSAEVGRRFEKSVAQWRREVEHRGMYSENAGHVRSYYESKIDSDNLVRSFEGAMARCYGVPVVSIILKNEFNFDKDEFGTVLDRQRYLEADYIGMAEGDLIVSVAIWDDNSFDIVLRAIPLYAILGIGVLYQEAPLPQNAA